METNQAKFYATSQISRQILMEQLIIQEYQEVILGQSVIEETVPEMVVEVYRFIRNSIGKLLKREYLDNWSSKKENILNFKVDNTDAILIGALLKLASQFNIKVGDLIAQSILPEYICYWQTHEINGPDHIKEVVTLKKRNGAISSIVNNANVNSDYRWGAKSQIYNGKKNILEWTSYEREAKGTLILTYFKNLDAWIGYWEGPNKMHQDKCGIMIVAPKTIDKVILSKCAVDFLGQDSELISKLLGI